jgi:hypothetical protein
MKTDDDLAGSSKNLSSPENKLEEVKQQRNYTEREWYEESKKFQRNLKGEFQEGKGRHMGKKTRNELKRSGKGLRSSNPHDYSSSSIFSLSNDDTYKSLDKSSKLGGVNFAIEKAPTSDREHYFIGEEGEGELDSSYLSKWQKSLPDSIGRKDNSMSYDHDVLNQRSDPTLNQINPKYSITKVFYNSDSKSDEEEKHIHDYKINADKSPEVFDGTESDLNINKNLESEFMTSVNSLSKFNMNSKLEDLLSFEDVVKGNAKSALLKNSNIYEDISNKDLELSEILNKNKTLHEKDELINHLLNVIRNLNVKIQDMENTSRANFAMLDNVI